MNLLEEKWLPVRRNTGFIDWIAPRQIAEPDIVAFAANRPDFNGALAQMMIGLLQTTTPVETEIQWDDFLDAPPAAEVLERWFAPVAEAFVLDGDKARFMQDFGMAEGAACAIKALLIDSPGESTIGKNTDHFVKRGTIQAMCPYCAAIAIFTLQTNAPEGGRGLLTGLRGGGPLTTLVVATESRILWRDLWLNVKPQSAFLEQGGDAWKTAKHFTFPWLAEIDKIQIAGGGRTQPSQVHPHHVFWAMPRRIRLDFSDVRAGQCDVCKQESKRMLLQYNSKPNGLDYKGPWRHPLSPYYGGKGDWLPVHPRAGSFSYKNWSAWVLGRSERKRAVEAASTVKYVLSEKRHGTGLFRLWVFGYDMESNKPRCWYETTFPLYTLAGSDASTKKTLQELAQRLIESSEQAVYYLRRAVKQAWFGDSDMRGDLGFVDKTFWDGTEHRFYQQLKILIEQARSDVGINMDDADFLVGLGESWLKVLRDKALQIFDTDIVGAGSISQQDPRRIAEAYNGLKRNLHGKIIRDILHLPVIDKAKKATKTSQQ